jgi:putative transposase
MVKRELSARRSCELLGISRRWVSHEGRRGKVDPVLGRLKLLAARHPRYGYRRLHVMLGRQGLKVNVKRVRRLTSAWSQLG